MANTVEASMYISVFVTCPECDVIMDLMAAEDTGGKDLNDDGEILNQAFPTDGSHRVDAHKRFELTGITCSSCSNKFNVKGLDW